MREVARFESKSVHVLEPTASLPDYLRWAIHCKKGQRRQVRRAHLGTMEISVSYATILLLVVTLILAPALTSLPARFPRPK